MKEKGTIKLSANENCYGCSPLALKAIQKKSRNVHLYPDYNPVALEKKLAGFIGVKRENIVIGAGSVRIIDGIIQTFVEQGGEALTFENSFIAYTQLSEIYKHYCIHAKQNNLRCDVNNLFPLINKKTRVIFIANPNNPTGTIITHNELETLLKSISSKIFVVLDEAYCQYVTNKDYPHSIELMKQFPNLIITRTFSKIYGLAGLRIGYAISERKNIMALKQSRIPFSINYLSADAAIAALQDVQFVKQSKIANAEQRDYLYHEFKKLGYNTVPSQANFIYLWFAHDVQKKKVYNMLLQNGIIICDMNFFGQEKALRITVGRKNNNKRMISLIKKYL